MTSTDDFLSVAQVAASLGVSSESVRRKIAAGQLHAVKLGETGPSPLRVSRADLETYLADHVVRKAVA